ncbi:MAG TPA: hypothetical protein VIN09_07525 [Chloroflexota bacterium]|jgi:hypothetical protein
MEQNGWVLTAEDTFRNQMLPWLGKHREWLIARARPSEVCTDLVAVPSAFYAVFERRKGFRITPDEARELGLVSRG